MRKHGVCARPECNRAGQTVRLIARGLCAGCYDRLQSRGELPPLVRNWRMWTGAETETLRRMRLWGYTYKTIARRLGRGWRAVKQKATALGILDPNGKAHGRGGPSLETQLARIKFIQTHGVYPDKDGKPGRKLPKWWNTEGDGRKRELIPRPEESTRADDE